MAGAISYAYYSKYRFGAWAAAMVAGRHSAGSKAAGLAVPAKAIGDVLNKS